MPEILIAAAQPSKKPNPPKPIPANLFEQGSIIRPKKIDVSLLEEEGSCSVNQCTRKSEFRLTPPVKKGNLITFSVSYTGGKTDQFTVTLGKDGKTVTGITVKTAEGVAYSIPLTDAKRVQSVADYLLSNEIEVSLPKTVAKS